MLLPRHFLSIGAVSLLAIFIASCSDKLAKQTGLTAQDLFSRGEQKYKAGKFEGAAEAYRLLLTRFPNSPLAPKAQLALAESHMRNKEEVEAEVAYDEFIRLYPADDNIPYALYRKGEALARQARPPGRDQTKTLEAVKAFTLAREKNPKGPYAEKSSAMIGNLRNRLAEHESLVVSHYLRRKHYDSAETRSRRALKEYPDTAVAPSLVSLLATALEKQNRKEEAAEIRKGQVGKNPAAEGGKP